MKNTILSEVFGRRKWLLTLGRGAVAGLMVTGLAVLVQRNGISASRETCIDQSNKTGCRHCGILNACGHPRALSAKKVLSLQENRSEHGLPKRGPQ